MCLDDGGATAVEHVVDASGDKSSLEEVKKFNEYKCQDQYVRILQPLHIPPEILVTDDNDSEAEVETPTKHQGPVYHAKTNGSCKMVEEDLEVEEEFILPQEVTDQQSANHVEDCDNDVLSDSNLREQLKINLKELTDSPRVESSQQENVKSKNHKNQSNSSVAKTVCKSLLGTTLVLCLILVILLYVMYEAEWDNYYLAKLRYTDIMEAFELDVYRPLRAKLVSFIRNIS